MLNTYYFVPHPLFISYHFIYSIHLIMGNEKSRKLNETLAWNQHTDILSKKISRAIGGSTQVKRFVSKYTRFVFIRTIFIRKWGWKCSKFKNMLRTYRGWVKANNILLGCCTEWYKYPRGGTWVRFCWVCAAGLSEPPPHAL